MRLNILFFLFITAFLNFSCEDEVIKPSLSASPSTRALVVDSNESLSNPDLIDDWENLSTITLNDPLSGGMLHYVSTPWSDGNPSSLSEHFRYDIKKEDGWQMLFHTFKEVGLDIGLNYICFYNHFTGYFKIFYYYDGNNSTQGVQWYIKTSGGRKIKMFDAPSYLANPDSKVASNDMLIISNSTDTPTDGISPGWNGFQFQVPRYCTDLGDYELKIGAYDKRITDYFLLGKQSLETVGTVSTVSSESSGISKALSNITGPAAKKFIDNLSKKLLGDAVVLGNSIASLILKIPSTGYISAMKGGLNMIFGRTTSTSTSDVALTTLGSVEMSGTGSSTETIDIPVLNVNLYRALNQNGMASGVVSPINSVSHLGVWTLNYNPKVYYNRMALISEIKYNNVVTVDGKQVELTGKIPLPTINHYDIEPVINPAVLSKISDYSVSVKFVLCNRLDGVSDDTHDISDVVGNFTKPFLYKDANSELVDYGNNKYEKVFLIDKEVYQNLPNRACWYDWGKIKDGRLLAIVSLDMKYSYNGVEKEVYDSKVFDVEYGVDNNVTQPEQVHYPPYTTVINFGYPYTNIYGWN